MHPLAYPLAFAVGLPHPLLGSRVPMRDGAVAGLAGGLPNLVLALHYSSPGEIAALACGPLSIGVVPLMPFGYVWLLASPALGEFDAPYSPLMDRPENRALSPPDRDAHAGGLALLLHLIDAESGVILAQRIVGMPGRFTAALRQTHEDALAAGADFSRPAWDDLRRVYEREHPSPGQGFNSPDLELFHIGGATAG